MKVKKINYQKCFNLGNYENHVIGIEIELGEDDMAADVLETAKKFVEKSNDKVSIEDKNFYEKQKEIVSNSEFYTADQVNYSKEWIKDFETEIDDLPF
jgi:hypothetical protein